MKFSYLFAQFRRQNGRSILGFMIFTLLVTAHLVMLVSHREEHGYNEEHKSVEISQKVNQITATNWRDIIKRLAPGLPKNCKELFKGVSKNFYPDYYTKRLADFKKKLHSVMLEKNVVGVEGHSGQLPQQQLFYWLLARQPHVKTVCEIGFNAGHSSLLWLSANENVTLYSFDINQHRYTQPMAEYLQGQFPGRLYVVYGPSMMTVPIVSQISQFKCDISIIDGAHTRDMAISDVINMRKISDDRTLVIIDDSAKDSRGRRNEVNEALAEMTKKNIVGSIYSCSFKMSSRGFALLSYKEGDV